MKVIKWIYLILCLVATITLGVSFFDEGVRAGTQITLLVETICFCCASAFAFGADIK